MIEILEGDNKIDLVVKKIYDCILSDKDYHTFINLLSKKYKIEKKEILINLKNYINTLTKEEQKEYKQKKKKIDTKIKVETEKNKYKYYFDFYLNNKNKNKSKIKEYANIYYEKYATKEEKERYKEIVKKDDNKVITIKDLNMFEKILSSENYIEILNSHVKNIKTLTEKSNNYLKFLKEKSKLNEEQLNSVKTRLNQILKEFKNIKQEEYQKRISLKIREKNIKEIEVLPKAETFVAKIINSDIESLNNFCDDNNISKKDLKEYIEIVKKLNPLMYEEYTKKAKEINNNKQQQLIDKSKIIVELLKKDFLKREKDFSIVDYYLITKISPKKLYNIASSYLTKEEKFLFLNFCKDNNNLHEIKPKELLKKEIVLNGRSLTTKEKKLIINYIQINKLPLYEEIFINLATKTKEDENVTRKSTSRI